MTRELQEKLESYQRVWAEVDLDAIWENMVHMKENIAENTKILAVIKTDGYGHGGVPIAKMLEQLDLYAEALERIFPLPVKEKYLYSFRLNQAIEV